MSISRNYEREFEEILRELRHIRRMLEPRFTLHIFQGELFKHYDPFGNWRSQFMAAITAGQSGSFFLSATASDNSTVTLTNPTLIADDSNVTIAPDTTDASGLTFTVTVPASDTATTFNLSATADASSNTAPTAQSVSATLAVTISPAAVPVTFTLTIGEK
jgi:hypothetical protein